MGTYYMVVNKTKQEHLDAFSLGESIKSGKLQGLLAVAVARLTCKNANWVDTELDGAWSGDDIMIVNDSGGGDSLYAIASNEYEDVSYKAIAVLSDDERVGEHIVRSMWATPSHTVPTLLKAIDAVHPYNRDNLQKPADAFFGKGWEHRSADEWKAWSFRKADHMREERSDLERENDSNDPPA